MASGLFLTYTDIDSREQRLVWISLGGEVQRSQWEPWLSDVHYAYWDGTYSVIVRFETHSSGDSTYAALSVHRFQFSGGVQVDSQTVYSVALPYGSVIATSAYDDLNGELIAAVFEVNTLESPLQYAAQLVRYDGATTNRYPSYDPGPFPVGSYIDYLGISHGPDGSVVLGYHVVLDNESAFWFRAMDGNGTWSPVQHTVDLLPEQQNSGIDLYVANQTVYAQYMTFSIAGPETQGGYVLGFPLTTILDVPRQPVPVPRLFEPAFPNPFNAAVTIPFTLAFQENVSLKIFDIAGREVATLLNGARYPAGTQQSVVWDAGGLPSGVYISRLETERFTERQKLLLLK